MNRMIAPGQGRRGLLGGILCVVATSCTVGPDYTRPALDVPAAYKSAASGEATPPGLAPDWWRLFKDPDLDALEVAALQANVDLKAAMARVMEARAAARITQGQFYPVITMNPLADRARSSANGPKAGGPGGKATTTTDFQIPFDLSYEIDIWGRVRRAVEASTAQAQATAYDYRVVLHTLEADVAQDYFTIRSLDSQVQILGQTVESYRRQLSLLETQFRAGLVSRIFVVQAETQLYSAMTQETELRRQRANLEHALAILLGRPPSDLTLAPHPLDLQPPSIPAGLPADLLRRRPDVAEAERNLAAASAQIGVATAQFYPDLRLTGAAGFESTDLLHLLSWESVFWSIGASALVPIFQGGQLEATLDQARARYDEMLAAYRSRVLGAFRDVEDALTDLHMRANAAEVQRKAVEAAREYVRLSDIQYQRGLVGYLLVIDAQRTLLSNELTEAQIANQRLVSTVLLIKALGAGWDVEAPPPTSQQ